MTIGDKYDDYVSALALLQGHLAAQPQDAQAISSAQEVVEDRWRAFQQDAIRLDTIHCRLMYETRKALEKLK